MQVEGNYQESGYALLKGLVPPEIGRAFVRRIKTDLETAGLKMERITQATPLTNQATVELYGFDYHPMLMFLWGLTPIVSELIGRDLLPSYNYFRIYREGDVCRVHSDRPSCEHSLSLTLDYSDGVPWNLEVGKDRIDTPEGDVEDTFGGAPFASLAMDPGDAVLYQGVHHMHGRTTPNPNVWSAHLFLHWVERGGPFSEFAFDGKPETTRPVNFSFE